MDKTRLGLVIVVIPLLAGAGFAALVGVLMRLIEQPLTREQIFLAGGVFAAFWFAVSLLWAKQHWRRA